MGDIPAVRHETRNDPMEFAALEGQVPAWRLSAESAYVFFGVRYGEIWQVLMLPPC